MPGDRGGHRQGRHAEHLAVRRLIKPTQRTRLARLRDRGSYDRDTVNAILDEALVCHVGFHAHHGPVVLPMTYARIGDDLFLHGAGGNDMLRHLAGGTDLCITVTLLDGLVFARSAFHHSMNYRSAVVFGRATLVRPDEKAHALRVISEQLAPGRWDEVRPPTPIELKQTSVLRLAIEEGSVKARTGGPIDDEDDLGLPVWAGVLPCTTVWGEPLAAADLEVVLPPSPSILVRRLS